MGRKSKFYVVWKGRETGIYTSWESCEKQVKSFEAARYKSFETEKEAKDALDAGPPAFIPGAAKKAAKSASGTFPIPESISVDAACSGNPGVMEYRGVITASGKQIFHQGPFPEGTVNIGEFLAIVHGLGYLSNHGSDIPLYSDSKTAIKWVKDKKANTKLEPNKKNKDLFLLVARAEAWLHKNKWNNPILKWDTASWGEIPADFGRK